ncbi:hypothetical protein [Lusitaniella coriacea]|uniref:hypothetical protein n=1 Tax=Lusitaniella coriacea TaxID=1983105 RepID=UPI003CF76CA5
MSNQQSKLLAFLYTVRQSFKPNIWLILSSLTCCFGQLTDSIILPQKAWAQSPRNASVLEENASEERYQVIGDRQGKIIVKDARSGEIIRTFQMEKGVVVRETFFLDNGQIIAASQKDKTIFWNLQTGQEIARLDQRVYGFSRDETRYFSFGSKGFLVYSYPGISPLLTCQISSYPVREGSSSKGVSMFQFSSNSRFLVVYFSWGFPIPDEDYPGRIVRSFRDSITGPGSAPHRRLFNLQSCQAIQANIQGHNPFEDATYQGEFSSDSMFYEVQGVRRPWQGRTGLFTVRLNLETHEVEQNFESFWR